MAVTYYSTNNKEERVNFKTALLRGQPADYGLYMVARNEIPKIDIPTLLKMHRMNYAQIAFTVLNPFLKAEIPESKLRAILEDAYDERKIPTRVQRVAEDTHIMWLTGGPTYSFKDYAARFFARALDHFLEEDGLLRTVLAATSGDTGGAVADGLHGLKRVDNIVFHPKGAVSEGQRRQMTTLGGNIYAFEVNGDFDVCQALAKTLLGDRDYAQAVFGDPARFTSANSISLGRVLPQAVYPFFAFSRISGGDKIVTSIPSGNFGDMLGTVIARQMGLPIEKIVCGVNENTEFPYFLMTRRYIVKPSKKSPSSAMIVSHPSNLARLIDFYEGHMYDERDPATRKVTREGVIDRIPAMGAMREDITSFSISNPDHYKTMEEVFKQFGIILDPHGAVGWRALNLFDHGERIRPSVIYETADPGKFPEDVKQAIGITPQLPAGMARQTQLAERIFSIDNAPDRKEDGALKLSDAQIAEAKQKIREIFK